MIQEFNKVDLMFVDDTLPNTLCLGITDHYDWTFPKEHLMVLQKKLNNYVTFIMNNGYITQMQGQSFSKFNIIILLKFQPVQIFMKFVQDYQSQLKKSINNIFITYKLFQE